jgi:hypothetical protein
MSVDLGAIWVRHIATISTQNRRQKRRATPIVTLPIVSDLRARISEAACVSHALASAARTHISPRTSATPLFRPQHESFWGTLLMPRPLRLTHRPRYAPAPTHTSAGRIGARGETMRALGKASGRFSNAFRVYKHHICTYTQQLPTSVQSSVPIESQPQHEPAALAVLQSAQPIPP